VLQKKKKKREGEREGFLFLLQGGWLVVDAHGRRSVGRHHKEAFGC